MPAFGFGIPAQRTDNSGITYGGSPITTQENIVQNDAATFKFALAAAEMAANTRGENIVLLDLRGRSPVTEFFVIATGTSPRQMRTVAEEMRELGKRMGFKAWQTSGVESARWILVDCVNVVVHIFSEESREFYDLELLWGDCPRIDWRKELGLPPAPEWKPRAPAPARLTEEERLAQDFGDEDDDDDDDDEDLDASVMVEIPDESTGSNSVEFIEVERPFKKRKKGRSSFPTTIEDEDITEEERSVYPIKSLGGSSESRDQDARQRRAEAKAADDVEAISTEDISRKHPKAGKKSSPKKAPAKKAMKAKAIKPKPKAAKNTIKAKPAKKLAARKPASKKAPVAKKSPAKKSPKKTAVKKKPFRKPAKKK